MAETLIDNATLLNAAANIREYGKEDSEGNYLLDNIKLSTGHDGYDMVFSNEKVSLKLNFHNTKDIDAPNDHEFDLFCKQIAAIDENY